MVNSVLFSSDSVCSYTIAVSLVQIGIRNRWWLFSTVLQLTECKLTSCKTEWSDCTDEQERQIIIESQNNLVWEDVVLTHQGLLCPSGSLHAFLPQYLVPLPYQKLHQWLAVPHVCSLVRIAPLVKAMTTKTTFPRNMYLQFLHGPCGRYVLVSVCCTLCLLFSLLSLENSTMDIIRWLEFFICFALVCWLKRGANVPQLAIYTGLCLQSSSKDL